MSKLYSYFIRNDDGENLCANASKSFLEERYNRRIRDKFLKRFQKKYEVECLEDKRREKNLNDQILKVFNKLGTAIRLQQEFISGKLQIIPQWASTFFTKQTMLSFLKSLPKEVELPEFPLGELVVNFIYFCAGLGLSWSHYFLLFKDGRETLRNVLFNQDYKSVLALAKVIYVVGVTKAYDEIIFRKEFYASFPNVDAYLLGAPSGTLIDKVYHSAALFAVGEISFAIFKMTLDKAVNQIQRLTASN